MSKEVNPAIKKRNKFYGLLIIAAIVLPMLLAYLMFKTGIGFPAGTSNKGELLIPPQPIQNLVLTNNNELLNSLYSSNDKMEGATSNSSASEQATTRKRWRILIPVTQNCDKRCQDNLYLTRQVHIRLAEKAYRVERILLLLDTFSVTEKASLKKEHPETLFIESSPQYFQEWLEQIKLPSEPTHYFYLVDQEGFTMMRYDETHSGQDLLDDIKKLLKFTYDK